MSSTSRLSTPVSLLTPSELHQLLSDPKGKRNGFSEFRRKRIENAAFWDLYVYSDPLCLFTELTRIARD